MMVSLYYRKKKKEIGINITIFKTQNNKTNKKQEKKSIKTKQKNMRFRNNRISALV
jgi:hypothetical protein